MFILATVVDTIRIPPHMLCTPSMAAVHNVMDGRYPNKVLMDVGLVVCRHGDCLKIGDGICVNGDGGAHHECLIKLVIFRPFVDEVCIGRIKQSTADGIQVTLGFFQDIFIPPYWMLRPSKYEAKTGLWVWTPNFDEDNNNNNNDDKEEEEEDRFEMEIGAEIRFKVKSINFTQVTNTAKGMQATTTTTAQAQAAVHPNPITSGGAGAEDAPMDEAKPQPVRKRSLSIELTGSENLPATMHVVASICEDGLGLTSWWNAQEEAEDDNEEGNEDQDAGDGEDESGGED